MGINVDLEQVPVYSHPRPSGRSWTSSRPTATTKYATLLSFDHQRFDVPCQLDTARTYAGGTSEEILGEVGWRERGLVMDTKLYPNAVRTEIPNSRLVSDSLCSPAHGGLLQAIK